MLEVVQSLCWPQCMEHMIKWILTMTLENGPYTRNNIDGYHQREPGIGSVQQVLFNFFLIMSTNTLDPFLWCHFLSFSGFPLFFFTQSWVGQDAKPSTRINCLSQKTHIMTPCRGLKYQLAVQAIYIFWWDVSASQPETISNMFQCFKLFTNTLPPHALDSKQRVSTLFQKWEISQSGKICQETHSDYSSSKFCKEPIQPTADEPPIAKFAQTFCPELASNANLYT